MPFETYYGALLIRLQEVFSYLPNNGKVPLQQHKPVFHILGALGHYCSVPTFSPVYICVSDAIFKNLVQTPNEKAIAVGMLTLPN